jgi:hypothetical protein
MLKKIQQHLSYTGDYQNPQTNLQILTIATTNSPHLY